MQTTDELRSRLQSAVEGDYALVRLLGRGGMGAVYLAREIALDRLVAIKVLPPDASENRDRHLQFRREAQLAAKLSHPNIVPLHSFGEKAGLSFYVMGFVRGESLADRLGRDGRMAHDEARSMLAQLADALDYAHGKGVIHRDIKPDNILIDDETGRPLLADFGIARNTGDGATHVHAGRIEGTVHYMSPEQAAGAASPDGRSDVYSLGVVGYVMLAGRTPFDVTSFSDFARTQATVDPPPLTMHAPDVPPDLSGTIMKCLARDPAQRWPNARTFKDALGAALDDDPDRLPGELREVSSAVFYSVLAGWVLGNAAGFLSPGPMEWMAALLAAVAFIATAAFHHRKGIAWADMRRVSLWPPRWWPFWWPARARRPGDLWDRLPPVVRRLRFAYGAIFVVVILGLPFALRAESTNALFWLGGGAQVSVTAAMFFTAWWAYRNGIPNNADLRSLILRSTADRRFWKRPQLAQRLLPIVATPVRGARLQTPAEYARHMSEATLLMNARAREIGLNAVEVARVACAAIASIDDELSRLPSGPDAAGRDVIQKRTRLATGLQTLCEQQLRVSREDTDEAIQRLVASVHSLTSEIGGLAAAQDSNSDSATRLGVTGLGVTLPAAAIDRAPRHPPH